MPSAERIDGNINPVPPNELKKKIANAFPTYFRNQFLLKTVRLVGVGSISLGIAAAGISYKIYDEGEQQGEADKLPKVTSEQ